MENFNDRKSQETDGFSFEIKITIFCASFLQMGKYYEHTMD